MSEVSGYINFDRIDDLIELRKKREVQWIGFGEPCNNCFSGTARYKLWNSGGIWETHDYCYACGFDTWEESAWWFNFDMMVLL